MNDWRDRARCRTWPPELFFPVGNTTAPDRQQAAKAKAVCRSCPVKAECCQWALDHNETGIWGGMDEAERRALRRQLAGVR